MNEDFKILDNDQYIIECRLSGAIIKPIGAIECNFDAEFPTWIIAYCPDTDSWFCTNKRFFYYEFPEEFASEKESIEYFRNHVMEFIELNCELLPKQTNRVFLENTMESYGD